MSRIIEERIGELAARQHGVITFNQLLEIGLSSGRILRRAAQGRLERMHRGVYRVGPMMLEWTREMAAVLAVGANARLSHIRALALWELIETGTDPRESPIHVTVTGAARLSRADVRVHRVASLDADEIATRHGIPVTSPARTLLDVAGVLGARELENAVAAAERAGLVQAESLLELLERRPRRPGAAALRAIATSTAGPALTRSPLEREARQLFRRAGLDPPQTNVRIGPYELDFLWPDAGFAVELDGFAYHGTRPRFGGDRNRDSWLFARGITVLRLSWRQITQQPIVTAVQVGQALARAAAKRAAV